MATIELPVLEATYEVSAEQIEAFQRDGFVKLDSLCSADEVAAYRAVITDAVERFNREQRPLAERDAFGKAFLQTMQLRRRDETCGRFVLAPRFGRVAAELMKVDGVRIYHDQALFKEPSGGINPTPWHQDLYYWPFDESTTCGMWMPLVDVETDMGGLRYASGSHRHGFLGHHEISDESNAVYEKWISDEGAEVVEMVPMKAGDALFHNGWTVHAAGPNRSQVMREAMIVTYFANGMRVGEISNPNKEFDRRTFLGGVESGEVADHDLNTLVYTKG